VNFFEAYEQMKAGKIFVRKSAPTVKFRVWNGAVQVNTSMWPGVEWYTAYMLEMVLDSTDWEVVE
jgi:hypothetical protein